MESSELSIGKYRLVAELGHGGMADVFLAVDMGPAGLGFSKLVVIKRLRKDLADDPDFVAMLVDEARIAARLNHPNIVQTIEIGEANGQYFLAMEYLDGQPLRRVANRANGSGGMPQSMHYGMLAEVLAGLHHAHELADYDGTPLRVVHRDVTPHNVLVTYDGQVKVVDFGIAKAVGRASETRHGMIKGKAAYMAPEQARAGPVDRRADIYSVGVMLWEAATRKRMWGHAIDEGEVIRSLVRGKIPASPQSIDPTSSEAIDAMCVRALAVNPDDRYATAANLEAELSAFLVQSGDRPSDREVGRYVSELFAETRRDARKIIESQLSQLVSPQISSFRTVSFPPASFTPTQQRPDRDGRRQSADAEDPAAKAVLRRRRPSHSCLHRRWVHLQERLRSRRYPQARSRRARRYLVSAHLPSSPRCSSSLRGRPEGAPNHRGRPSLPWRPRTRRPRRRFQGLRWRRISLLFGLRPPKHGFRWTMAPRPQSIRGP